VGVYYSPTMSEPEYSEIEAEEERRLLRSWGYWDLVALGALIGAGLGFLHGLGDESRQRAVEVFAGMGTGALCALLAGWARAKLHARERFFTRWVEERGWAYRPIGVPFDDTPLLRSGDRRKASDFFSGFWPLPGAVVYQHKRIVGSGRSEQTYTYLVLHFLLERPAFDQLLIWPRKHGKLFGDASASVDEIDLESTELMQHYRVGCLRGRTGEAMRLLQPSLIVRLVDFQRGLPDASSYFEIQGRAVAFLVEKPLSPQQPELITRLLELWKPIADWLSEEFGTATTARSLSDSPERTEPPF
jgi:hypothetical protein